MTLLIKNAQVIDGTGSQPQRLDVFVSGDKISALGSFTRKRADVVIDGSGAYLMPGFIDIENTADHYLSLFNDPAQESFLRQGVTTAIGGQCGSSLAPLLQGSLVSIRKWTNTNSMNVGWRTVKELFSYLNRKPLGINFASFVGHLTIRRAIIGETLRPLTRNEIETQGELLKKSLREGALGLSTGLEYIHSRPVSYAELKHLAQIVQQFEGVYSAHLKRDDGTLEESAKEILRLAEETGVKTLIGHCVPMRGSEEDYEKTLSFLADVKEDVFFDLPPVEEYTAELYTFLPFWAQSGSLETIKKNLKDPWIRSRIIKDLPTIRSKSFFVAHAPGASFLRGYSLDELRTFYGSKNSQETLLKLMDATGLRATIVYRNVNKDLLKRALAMDSSLIGSYTVHIPNTFRLHSFVSKGATETFLEFLRKAEREQLMSLESAVRKITSTPARFLGLRNRGEIRHGNYADMVLLRNQKVDSVIVNGKIAFQNGRFTDIFAGKVARTHA